VERKRSRLRTWIFGNGREGSHSETRVAPALLPVLV